MKRNLFALLLIVTISLVMIPSCKEDEGFHQISTIEREIYLKINQYRTENTLSTLVEQFLLFKEGRIISEKLAAGTYQLGDPDAQEDVNEISSNLGGNSNALLTLTSNVEDAEGIVNSLITDPSTSNVLKGIYTQCGVGFSKSSDGLYYIAIMLINIPD